MPSHKNISFDSLHKAKLETGTNANRPSAPEGIGDTYFAPDGNGGNGALYITNVAGDSWVEFQAAADVSSASIGDLSDVNITSVSDGQFLKYVDADDEWQNDTLSLVDLDDVAGTLSHVKGSILVSNGTNINFVGVGTNGQALLADSSEARGVRWGEIQDDDAQILAIIGW